MLPSVMIPERFGCGQFYHDTGQADDCRRRRKPQNHDLSLIMQCGPSTNIINIRISYHPKCEHQIERRRTIPCHQQARRSLHRQNEAEQRA